jgi:preprotein translocase subunit SecF
MIELIKNPDIDFMGKRYVAFALSAALILLGVIGIVQISRGKANHIVIVMVITLLSFRKRQL